MVFADARTDAIVRRCCSDANIVESIARSCYVQGVWDGVQVALAHPEVFDMVREATKGANDVEET
jgi:hypothetical protein